MLAKTKSFSFCQPSRACLIFYAANILLCPTGAILLQYYSRPPTQANRRQRRSKNVRIVSRISFRARQFEINLIKTRVLYYIITRNDRGPADARLRCRRITPAGTGRDVCVRGFVNSRVGLASFVIETDILLF